MKAKRIASNMTQVELNEDTTVLVSYETPVACHIQGQGYFRTAKKWSSTTSKHINKWLGMMGARGPAAERPQEFFNSLGA